MKQFALAILVVFCALALSGCRDNQRAAEFEVDLPIVERSAAPYIKAAHWFGDGWPVNLWNTDLEAVARSDFQKIQDDGFNTIVFLVPWPGFAPDATSGVLDEVRVQRLKNLMNLANELGLMSILRVSYAWDALDDSSGLRLKSLWLDDSIYQGWLSYLEALWLALGDVPGLQFGFFSWEDLWAIISVAEAELSHRQSVAAQLGFDGWVKSRYTESELQETFGVTSNNPLPIPHRRERAFALFLEYVNEAWIERYFKPAQEKFPKLSMEIRIDSDPIYDGDELVDWFHHTNAWELPGAEWVTLYWSPAMGGQNTGEELTPEEAAFRLHYWLGQVAEHAGPKHIFIGQFLAEDFTPGYEMNGRVPRDQVGEFLELVAPILNVQASGVGLWTWKDYAHDAVPNPQFFAGLERWSSATEELLTDQGVLLSNGQALKFMTHLHEYHAPGGPEQASLCVRARSAAEDSANLIIYQGHSTSGLELGNFVFHEDEVSHCVDHTTDVLSFIFQADGGVLLREVNSVGFVQISGMRALDRSAKSVARSYSALNAQLTRRPQIQRPMYDDGWMGRYWRESLMAPSDSAAFILNTHLPDDWPVSPNLTVAINGQPQGTWPCIANGEYRMMTAELTRDQAMIDLSIESDAIHAPMGDQRALACVLTWDWAPARSTSPAP